MRFAFSSAAIRAVIDGARSWRIARDAGDPVQPSLYKRLERWGAGLLAPVLDSVMSLFEAGFRRRFRAGHPSDDGFTYDEQNLLAMLDGKGVASADGFDPGLSATMRIALRSARIMLGSVIGDVIALPLPAASSPIFFPVAAGVAAKAPGHETLYAQSHE